jgi:cytochrome c-type biogenesis protein
MDVNGFIAFIAGVASFFSPCVLPLVPSYLVFLSGATISNFGDLARPEHKRAVLIHSVSFILGFSLVFIALGVSSSFLGSLLLKYQRWILQVGGLLLVIMGLNSLNILKIPFLNREKAIHLSERPIGLLGSFAIGVTFSLGWTPCIGPILSSILIIASATNAVAKGVWLLALYSLGLAIPFFVAALLADRLMYFLQKHGYVMKYSSMVIGVMLIVIGILLMTEYFTELAGFLTFPKRP